MDSEPDEDTCFALETMYQIQPEASPEEQDCLLIKAPIPQTLVHIYFSKYDKPIDAVAFFDTGAQLSILHPDLLPPE